MSSLDLLVDGAGNLTGNEDKIDGGKGGRELECAAGRGGTRSA